jgi:hypothetical protein
VSDADDKSGGKLEASRVSEGPGAVLHLEFDVSVPPGDEVVGRVREGDAAADPESFVTAFGGPSVDGATWSAPTLTYPDGGKAQISTTAVLSGISQSSTYTLDFSTGSLDLTLKDLRIVSVQGQVLGARQSATRLTGTLTGYTQVSLHGPVGAVPADPASGSPAEVMGQLRMAAGQVWTVGLALLRGTAAWGGLWLAGRWACFGRLGRRRSWLRLMRLVGLVLGVHVVVTAFDATYLLELPLASATIPVAGWATGYWTTPTPTLASLLLLLALTIAVLPCAVWRWRHLGHLKRIPAPPRTWRLLGWTSAFGVRSRCRTELDRRVLAAQA